MSAGFTVTGAGFPDVDCPDVYFTSGYGAATALLDDGTWQIAHQGGLIMLPYVLRAAADDASDAATPYGYSGIHVAPGLGATDLGRFWSKAVEHWRDTGTVALFLRFSPLDTASVEAVRALGEIELTRRQDTITVEVSAGSARVWDGMEGRSRTAIRKARGAGLTAAVRAVRPEDLVATAPFRRLYESTMARLNSQPWYLFPDRYYRHLATALDKALSIAEVRDSTGEVVASALVLRHRDRAHYHLAGSDPVAARTGANNLLVWTILEWACDSGCRVVHLGGGVRSEDGLFRFKRSFGGTRTPFWTGTAVIDPGRYDALVDAQARRLGRSGADLRSSGYFPAYRTPGV